MKLLRVTSALAVLAVGIPTLLVSAASADTPPTAICAPLSNLPTLPVFSTTPSLQFMKDGQSAYAVINTAFQKAILAVPFDSANGGGPNLQYRIDLINADFYADAMDFPGRYAIQQVALAAAKGDSRQALNIEYKFLEVRSISANKNILKDAAALSPFVVQTCNVNILAELTPPNAATTTTIPATTTTIAPTSAQVASGYAASLAYGHVLMRYITAHHDVSIRSAIAATPRGRARSVSLGRHPFSVKYIDSKNLIFCVKMGDPPHNRKVTTHHVSTGSAC